MREFNNDFRYIAERLDKTLNVIDEAVKRTAREKNVTTTEIIAYENIKADVFEQFAIKHMTEILDRLFEHLTPMFKAIQELGYTVTRNGNTVMLTNHSPAYEELNVTLLLDSDEDVTLQLYDLSDSFDAEDHVYDLHEAKKNELAIMPTTRELIDDAVCISNMYKQLYDVALNARTLYRD